uniref:Uncharacterized protein n=1 Tax=Oryza meridionalis TaxID=40149 RepID=A0A0E0CI53_9ORYZ
DVGETHKVIVNRRCWTAELRRKRARERYALLSVEDKEARNKKAREKRQQKKEDSQGDNQSATTADVCITSWLNGAFSKVAKAVHVAGSRTREKFQIAVSNLTAKVYDLQKAQLVKKLESGVRENSSISIHPGELLHIALA